MTSRQLRDSRSNSGQASSQSPVQYGNAPYQYSGAKALVELHDRHLRQFWQVWQRTEEANLALPWTSNPDYASREALLLHVLGCAARYLTWLCAQLEIPTPEIEERPALEGFASRAAEYLESVLAAWQIPLRTMTEDQAFAPEHKSAWGAMYCLDAMLEHAAMHPVRHSFQLEALLQE